jgi:MarR family transcriptional regulator for hemolysin
MASKSNSPRSARRVARPGRRTPDAERTLRWEPEVTRSGELFLRRRAGHPHVREDMRFPFTQGLTFVARRWRNLMNEELGAIGQSQARWGVLYWIAVFGDSVNQTELAERIGVEQPTLGRILDGLERDGLIERRMRSADQRAKVIQLTRAARPVMRQIGRIGTAVSRRLLDGIDPQHLIVCMSVFARILDNFERP